MPTLPEILYEYGQFRAADQRRRDRIRSDLMKDGEYARLEGQVLFLRRQQALNVMSGLEEKDAFSQIAGLRAQQESRMAALGVDPRELAPVWRCPICRDTGYAGGRLCECVLRRLPAGDQNVLPPPDPGQTFDAFDETLFADEPFPGLPAGVTMRDAMRRIRSLCMQYVQQFPDNPKPNLIFTGKTGLGKTFMMNCIANRLLGDGWRVAVLTAYELQERVMNGIRKGEDALGPLIECDLICLDDLGSESFIRNVTDEKLMILVNERTRRGKAMVIATNLNMTQIGERYGERVASRLRDRKTTQTVLFAGEDARLRRRA